MTAHVSAVHWCCVHCENLVSQVSVSINNTGTGASKNTNSHEGSRSRISKCQHIVQEQSVRGTLHFLKSFNLKRY